MALRDFLIAPPEVDPARECAADEAGDAARHADDVAGHAGAAAGSGRFRLPRREPREGAASDSGRFGMPRREPRAAAASDSGRFRLPRREPREAAAAVAASIGVLAAARDVRAVGVAVGVVVARRHPAALVCVHAPGDAPHAPVLRAPARPAAARLAASLRACGLSADARGKVALVDFAATDAEPAAAAARAVAAAGPLPTVLAVAARDPDVDALLSAQDAIVVALPPSIEPALAELATTSACALAANAASMTLTLDPGSRTLALAGLRAPAALRAVVEALLA
jgi:hypothetical protein